jgi:hypothetical protein
MIEVLVLAGTQPCVDAAVEVANRGEAVLKEE